VAVTACGGWAVVGLEDGGVEVVGARAAADQVRMGPSASSLRRLDEALR
jgi:hypothetical protein